MLTLVLCCVLSGEPDSGIGLVAQAIMGPLVRVKTPAATGSGVVLYSADREKKGEFRTFVCTNHHVIREAIHVVRKWNSLSRAWEYAEANDPVQVEVFQYLRGGRTVVSQPLRANIRAYKEEEDLAIVELDYPIQIDDVATILPEGEKLHMFQEVWAVGCSLGDNPLASHGEITVLEEIIDHKAFVMASAPIIFGNSGGGTFTRIGERFYFCGVPSRVRVTRDGAVVSNMGYFITPERVREFLVNEELVFLLDPRLTPEQCFAKRAKLQKKGHENGPELDDNLGPPPPDEDK